MSRSSKDEKFNGYCLNQKHFHENGGMCIRSYGEDRIWVNWVKEGDFK